MGPRSAILLATPRSGSYLGYSLLKAFLKDRDNLEGLGEFFSPTPVLFRENNGIILSSDFRYQEVHGPRRRGVTLPAYRKTLKERVRLFRKYSGRYFLKAHPHQISPQFLGWAKSQVQWFYIERKDLFAQVLSFLISSHSDKFYVRGGLRIPNRSVPFDLDAFKVIETEIFSYHLLKKMVPGPVLVYEDIVALGPREAFIRAGIYPRGSRVESLNSVTPYDRQNGPGKIMKFENPLEVIEAYRESYLNCCHPIPRPAGRSKKLANYVHS